MSLSKSSASTHRKSGRNLRRKCRRYQEGRPHVRQRRKGSIFYSMGVTQHTTGTEGSCPVQPRSSVRQHRHRVGGVNPCAVRTTSKAPATWAAFNVFSGYSRWQMPRCGKIERAWDAKLSDKPGLTLCDIVHKAGHGDISSSTSWVKT
jgi:formate dehydrogenase major subunit